MHGPWLRSLPRTRLRGVLSGESEAPRREFSGTCTQQPLRTRHPRPGRSPTPDSGPDCRSGIAPLLLQRDLELSLRRLDDRHLLRGHGYGAACRFRDAIRGALRMDLPNGSRARGCDRDIGSGAARHRLVTALGSRSAAAADLLLRSRRRRRMVRRDADAHHGAGAQSSHARRNNRCVRLDKQPCAHRTQHMLRDADAFRACVRKAPTERRSAACKCQVASSRARTAHARIQPYRRRAS